ncbi:hypothetical protein QR90_08400 [Deinococcus radiopugnans]|uniref:PASTA domain-containing protein n=1 Tax=Deinococcus radiopugnans TaxID=57497 RepID=A0A0A7KG92_9DEIO|nr:PASTA domain-containing protein [Deinococcus radiopugnans]AIZ45120.1 hypothetical protein QR90_08400 [Deinococcus radiopugnans]
MPAAFTVTTATNTVTLGSDRHGEATFVVTNVSGRPMQGRALLEWQPRATDRSDWAAVQGEAERVFPIAGTQQYTVKFTLPPTAPEGQHILRLDMQDVSLPDDVVQGQSVTLQVASPVPRGKFPWWVLAVAAVVLLGGVGAFLLLGRDATVQNVAGLSLEKARAVVTGAGLTVADPLKTENDDTVPQSVVIRSEPGEGSKLKKGSAVTLVLSNGPSRHPMNFVGKDGTDALKELVQWGLKPENILLSKRWSTNNEPVGTVLSTTPPQGQDVTRNDTVTLAISRGPCRSTVLVLCLRDPIRLPYLELQRSGVSLNEMIRQP